MSKTDSTEKSLTLVAEDLDALGDDDIVDLAAYPALIPFISVFPENFFKGITLTKAQLLKVLEETALVVCTNRTLPVLCRGAECPIRHMCSLDMNGIAPVGHMCAIERMSMVTWRREYIESLGVNTKDKVQMGLVDELVEIDIFNKYRFPAVLSENMTSFQEKVETFSDRTGALVQSRKEVSKAFEAKMAMSRRREVILRELIATPMHKAKLKRGKKRDPATELSNIADKAQVAIEDVDDNESS